MLNHLFKKNGTSTKESNTYVEGDQFESDSQDISTHDEENSFLASLRKPVFDDGFEPTETVELLLLDENKEILKKHAFKLPIERAIRNAAVSARKSYPDARYITALHTTWTANIYNDWQVFNDCND